jgi:hypothetical protein
VINQQATCFRAPGDQALVAERSYVFAEEVEGGRVLIDAALAVE